MIRQGAGTDRPACTKYTGRGSFAQVSRFSHSRIVPSGRRRWNASGMDLGAKENDGVSPPASAANLCRRRAIRPGPSSRRARYCPKMLQFRAGLPQKPAAAASGAGHGPPALADRCQEQRQAGKRRQQIIGAPRSAMQRKHDEDRHEPDQAQAAYRIVAPPEPPPEASRTPLPAAPGSTETHRSRCGASNTTRDGPPASRSRSRARRCGRGQDIPQPAVGPPVRPHEPGRRDERPRQQRPRSDQRQNGFRCSATLTAERRARQRPRVPLDRQRDQPSRPAAPAPPRSAP